MAGVHRDRVLLVDDEPQMLVALEDLLGDRFTVLKTTSPDEALRVLEQEHDIAVVLTDQRMPKMTGDQLLSKLEPSCRALRILITGFADLGAVVRAVNEGQIFAYITKPWDAADLVTKVDRAVEHFHSNQELVNERQLLHDLMVHSPDGIYLKDRELRFSHVNRAFIAQNGGRPELQVLGQRVSALHDDQALVEDIESEERAVIDSGEPVLDVLRPYPHASGARWLSETKAPIRSNSGNVVGLLSISRDVTERALSQQALAESETRLRSQTQLLNAILDNLAEGVLVADSRGAFLLCNRQAKELLGVGPGDPSFNAHSWRAAAGAYQLDRKTLLQPEDDPLLRAMGGEPWCESEIFVRNGSQQGRSVVMTATPLLGVGGAAVGGIAVLRDVTEHKALEQRLAQAHKLEAVGRLAGGIAHDFNNLLSVIQGCTGLVLANAEPGEQREDLEQVLAASERAANLTKQLIMFSRQQISQRETLQLNDIVTQLSAMLGRVLGEDVRFTTQLDPGLQTVEADRSQIEQIVVNLTVNARDAMPQGGKLSISTRNVQLREHDLKGQPSIAPGEFILLTVTDTGVGMDAQTQARMFEPYYTTKDVGKGTGLGLATVYGIVRHSGGFLNCASQVDRGSVFEVYLPASRGLTLLPARDEKPQEKPGQAIGTILLVEDEDAVRMIALRVLRTQGYRVLEARKASEARRIYEQQAGQIDLLLTDIVMPDMSGPQLEAALRLVTPQLRVLYVSGYAGAAAPPTEGVRSNVWFLEKPFTATSLLEKVAEALKRASK